MEINNRIKYLRKDVLKLTQEQFAEKILFKRNTLGLIEIGKNAITDRTIADICRVFNVNENWLRYGIEPIRIESDNTIFSKVIEEYNIKDEVIITIMKNFLNMSNDDKLDLINKANMLLASTQNMGDTTIGKNIIPLEYVEAKHIARNGETGSTFIKTSDIDKLVESDEDL